jgi:hypothetical protein
MMAAVKRAKTIANPAPDPTCKQQRDDSEGHGACGGNDAGEIPEAGPHYGNLRVQGMSVDHRGDCVGGIVESIYKFESERDQQRQAQQNIRPSSQELRAAQVSRDAGTDEDDAANQHADKN